MGRKIELALFCENPVEDIRTFMVNSLSTRYLLNLIYTDITNHSSECDMSHIQEKYEEYLEEANDIIENTIQILNEKREKLYSKLLDLVVEIDKLFSDSNITKPSEYSIGVNSAMTSFLLALTSVEVTSNSIDFDKIMLHEDYISTLEYEWSTIDENQFMMTIAMGNTTITPINKEKFQNTFIESKLNTIDEIINDVNVRLDEDMLLLSKQIDKIYSKLYSIFYDTLTDDEKVEKATKVISPITKHRNTYVDMEKSLKDANELSRQLTIHQKRLQDSMQEELATYEKKIKEHPEDRDLYQSDIDSLKFVTNNYFDEIENSKNKLQAIKDSISARAKMLDGVENAINSALPTEGNMEKYTSLGFKFQDLRNRLEISKSQVQKNDKEMLAVLDTAVVGLGVLIKFSVSSKDVFVRNSMLHSLLNCYTSIFDVVDNADKSLEMSEMAFVNTRMSEYSNATTSFDNDMATFRHVANNAIRDLSIMMSKTLNISSLKEIVDYLDITLKQLEQLLLNLDKKHEEQTQILQDILKINF